MRTILCLTFCAALLCAATSGGVARADPPCGESNDFAVDNAVPVDCAQSVTFLVDNRAACCQPDGSCALTALADCVAPGVWHGDWTLCDPNPCTPACLLLGDVNQDDAVNGLDIDGFVRAKLGLPEQPGENQQCADYGHGDLAADVADFVADLLGL